MKFWFDVDGAVVRASATVADAVREGIKDSVDVDQTIQAFRLSYPFTDEKRRVSGQVMRDWARLHIRATANKLGSALATVYGTGWALGEDVAGAAYAHAALNKADKPKPGPPNAERINQLFAIDWSTWTPGNRAAANLVKPKGGLRRLLDSRGTTIKGLNNTTLDRIGTRLADALNAGLPDTALRQMLMDVLDDPRRALTIANTEMARATSVASLNQYQEFGLQQVEWLALDPCDICAGNADDGPVDVGSEFSSGDTEPPAHPNCRCSLIPVVDGMALPVEDGGESDLLAVDTIELAAVATLNKFVPGPNEVERAHSRLAILPNPADPRVEDPEKWVESPWRTVPVPTVNPNSWDDAQIAVINLDELLATDPFMHRKRVKKHIDAMGQALTPNRSYPLVVEVGGHKIIIDGHHRLIACWLLGQDQAAVWLI